MHPNGVAALTAIDADLAAKLWSRACSTPIIAQVSEKHQGCVHNFTQCGMCAITPGAMGASTQAGGMHACNRWQTPGRKLLAGSRLVDWVTKHTLRE